MKSAFKLFALLIVSGMFLTSADLQAQDGYLDVGGELQLYPTGIIPGIRIAKSWNNRDEFHLRLGYQFIDHRDLGKHASETGSGYGLTLGYRYYYNSQANKWAMGVRTDLWFNTIDWNTGETTDYSEGTTEIIVIQPTFEVSYLFELGEGNWNLAPSVAFGYEMNVKTEGEPTGEGPILLIGATISRRL